jgi:iron complex outermembrane receptor protein
MLGRIAALAPAPIVATAIWVASGTAQPAQPPTLPKVTVEERSLTDDRTRTTEEAKEEIQRVPGGVEIVPQQKIEEGRAANLKDALDFIPGVMVRSRFGAADESQLSIRGSGLRNNFHLRGINVLIDGFPYGQADGFSDFEALELLVTKRIEVYKGANALRFGGNTLGGAINLVTKTGRDAGLVEMRTEAGSFGFLKNYLGTGQVYGPFDIYVGLSDTELNGYRDWADQLRRRAFLATGYALPGGTTLRLDLQFVHSEERLPGSLTRQEFDKDPTKADPTNVAQRAARNYDYTRGAFTLRTPLTETQVIEWATQLNYQDLHHPLSFAIIDDTTYAWSTEIRYIVVAPLFGHGNRFTVGFQYFDTRQIDANFQNNLGNKGAMTKNQINMANNFGLYTEDQFDITPLWTFVIGGRAQYAFRQVRDRFLSDGNQSGRVDFLSFSPRAGVIYKPAPTVQVFANASHAYEPPLLLELTAPGQLPGNIGQLAGQTSWQFEVGTRGTAWDRRITWDVSIFDIELWDEIQNVNIQPFPFASFTIPRFQNIDRSRHTGVEAGFDVVVAKDIASRMGLGKTGDALTARVAYTWSHFQFVNNVNFGNNRLPGVPGHFIQAETRYDHGSGFWFAPGVEVVPWGYNVDSQNDARTSAYTLFNIRMGYVYPPWGLEAFFEARNLSNANYASSVQVDSATRRFFEPGDGRAFYGGLAWRFK